MKKSANEFVCWFTGLPCSGKTTLAQGLKIRLEQLGLKTVHLDGDILRKTTSSDLGFSRKDRMLQVERVAQLALEATQLGKVAIVSIVSPFQESRKNARKQIKNFIEIYLRCPLDVCERRDVKGMYKLARQKKIQEFTGISSPYEEPQAPDIMIDTDKKGVEESLDQIVEYLSAKKLFDPSRPA